MASNKEVKKPVVYSALEVAKICGVVNQTAINWIKNNYLKAFKTPGGQFRVYPEDLVEFMKKRDMRVPEEVLRYCIRKKISLLIVDDDVSLNNVVKKFLAGRIENLEIYQAFDGFEAGALMEKLKPSILILDLGLPGVDGLKLLEKLRSSEEYSNTTIIVITASMDQEMDVKCWKLGVAKIFKKPVSLPQLSEAVEEIAG